MPNFKEKYLITQKYLTKQSKRRSGLMMSPGVKFIVAHDTGNPKSTASANVRYYENSRNDQSASAHLFVDDKEIIECIPALTGPPEKAWHVLYNVPTDNQLFGFNANDAAVGVEYCYGGNIDADEAYRKYLWTMACICHKFGLDPAKHIIGHFMLDPARKSDPATGLAQSRRTYDRLLLDIAAEFAECTGAAVASWKIIEGQGRVVTTVRLNIRKDAPRTKSPVAQIAPVGSMLEYTGWTDEGEPINGNPRWYRDANGCFFWSGGIVAK